MYHSWHIKGIHINGSHKTSKEGGHFGDLGVNERIILKWDLKNVRIWTEFI
jgi:hypothetical protein